MCKTDFARGVITGVIAGTAVWMIVAPSKKGSKTMAGKALKAAGDLVENISDFMGL